MHYNVIVVGAGHAGAEAAMASAHLGATTLLITLNLDSICQMSCNPAMGGVAKGQIVREIDAIGGMSGIVTDNAMIQFRMLNKSKGPAMWSPRAQCDKALFASLWKKTLESTPNLHLWQDEVVALKINKGRVEGVFTRLGVSFDADAVILTNGTFLNGKIFIGEYSSVGGRIGEYAAHGLSEQLLSLGFQVERLKTGTPVRVDGRSIDFSKLDIQQGDDIPQRFSFTNTPALSIQMPCYMAYTNTITHDILKTGFDKSPLYTGRIQGHGPRYCPSIEDKIVRFADKSRHQLFVEPEGRNTNSYYINGFSSSLPLDVQLDALHSIVGFENARIYKPGYAIEYDFFPPTQLKYTLETKNVDNLFFAGQINGTTGYEEAACQGLMAGINAYQKINDRSAFVLSRSQGYIGVLIDDLVSKGVDEPYRMFTSRAEYRILLRQDNADQRLTPLAYKIGLASEERLRRVEEKNSNFKVLSDVIRNTSVAPAEVNDYLLSRNSPVIQQRVKAHNLLLRPELSIDDILNMSESVRDSFKGIDESYQQMVAESVEIELKYERYIEKEQEVANRILKFENVQIPDDIDFFSISSLSYESREKLNKMRPKTIGQASRITGISPADVSVLLILLDSKH